MRSVPGRARTTSHLPHRPTGRRGRLTALPEPSATAASGRGGRVRPCLGGAQAQSGPGDPDGGPRSVPLERCETPGPRRPAAAAAGAGGQGSRWGAGALWRLPVPSSRNFLCSAPCGPGPSRLGGAFPPPPSRRPTGAPAPPRLRPGGPLRRSLLRGVPRAPGDRGHRGAARFARFGSSPCLPPGRRAGPRRSARTVLFPAGTENPLWSHR